MYCDEKAVTDGAVIVGPLNFDAAFELTEMVDFKVEFGSVVFSASADTVDAEAVGII